MRSATNSGGPQLVRIAVPCAQTRVAKETHPRLERMAQSTIHFERPA